MKGPAIVAIFDGAVAILQQVIPAISGALKSGEISADDQKLLKDRLDALRDPNLFSGPEWKIE